MQMLPLESRHGHPPVSRAHYLDKHVSSVHRCATACRSQSTCFKSAWSASEVQSKKTTCSPNLTAAFKEISSDWDILRARARKIRPRASDRSLSVRDIQLHRRAFVEWSLTGVPTPSVHHLVPVLGLLPPPRLGTPAHMKLQPRDPHRYVSNCVHARPCCPLSASSVTSVK